GNGPSREIRRLTPLRHEPLPSPLSHFLREPLSPLSHFRVVQPSPPLPSLMSSRVGGRFASLSLLPHPARKGHRTNPHAYDSHVDRGGRSHITRGDAPATGN